MTFGIVNEGFRAKRLDEIKADIEARLTDALGPIDLRDESVFGQHIGIFSELHALIWALTEVVYNSQYPDTAEGRNLDLAVGINGIVRIKASPTKVEAVVFGTDGTTLSTSRQAANAITGHVYQLTSSVVISKDSAVHAEISVPVAAEETYAVTVGGVDYAYSALSTDTQQDILQGLFNAMAGAAFTREILDGVLIITTNSPTTVSLSSNLTLNEVGTLANFVAVNDGAQLLPVGRLTDIVTPVAGWSRVTNRISGVTGTNRETDEELRIRRTRSIQITARHTLDALTSRLSQTEGVTQVNVRENNGTDTDQFGTPRQHVWVVVEGGTDNNIAAVIYNTVAGGIGTRGDIEVLIASDITGKQNIVRFDRPVFIEPTIDIEIIKLSGFPVDGEQRIKNALVEWGMGLGIESKLVFSQLYTPINSVGGVQVDDLKLNGQMVNIQPQPNERIRILFGNINIVDVTP